VDWLGSIRWSPTVVMWPPVLSRVVCVVCVSVCLHMCCLFVLVHLFPLFLLLNTMIHNSPTCSRGKKDVEAYKLLYLVTSRVHTSHDVIFDNNKGWKWTADASNDGPTTQREFTVKFHIACRRSMTTRVRLRHRQRKMLRSRGPRPHDTLHKLGFRQSKYEHAICRTGSDGGRFIVGVYVDDLIITGMTPGEIVRFKEEMMLQDV
jgi:hypothetical protein